MRTLLLRRVGAHPAALVAAAKEQGVLIGAVGATSLRLVTHLDVSSEDTVRAASVLRSCL